MNFENCLHLKKEFHQLKLSVFTSANNYIDLSIVNPDLQPEKQIIDKLLEFSLQNNAHRYSSAQGLPEIRQAIASRYQDKYNVKVNWQDQITIARGTNSAIANILNLFYKKNNRKPKVLLPTPTYSMHLELAKQTSSDCFFYNLNQSEVSLVANIKDLITENQIDILILNFPNNPTGKIVSSNFYASLAKELNELATWIINDFVYADLTFEQEHAPSLLAAGINHSLFEIFSLSKSHSLAGWRLAIILGQAGLIKELIQNQTEVDYGSYQGFQRAVAFAVSSGHDYSKITKDTYRARADLLGNRLKKLAIQVESELSGCYLWCKLPPQITKNSFTFCQELLLKQKLALQPGEIFGEKLERYFRISLTTNESQLKLAADRLEAFLNTL